jgi:hypothetical protein
MGLELGLALWSYSPAFTAAANEHLSVAYMLLGRDAFATILREHTTHRNACASPPFPHPKGGSGSGSGSGTTVDNTTDSSFKRRFFKK